MRIRDTAREMKIRDNNNWLMLAMCKNLYIHSITLATCRNSDQDVMNLYVLLMLAMCQSINGLINFMPYWGSLHNQCRREKFTHD